MSLIDLLLPELEVAIAQSAPVRRSDILLSVLDAFARNVHRFSDAEIAVFDDILLRLAGEIELAAREKLALGHCVHFQSAAQDNPAACQRRRN
jgi:hypothetical protein